MSCIEKLFASELSTFNLGKRWLFSSGRSLSVTWKLNWRKGTYQSIHEAVSNEEKETWEHCRLERIPHITHRGAGKCSVSVLCNVHWRGATRQKERMKENNVCSWKIKMAEESVYTESIHHPGEHTFISVSFSSTILINLLPFTTYIFWLMSLYSILRPVRDPTYGFHISVDQCLTCWWRAETLPSYTSALLCPSCPPFEGQHEWEDFQTHTGNELK